MLPVSRRLKRSDFKLIQSVPKKVFSSNNFSLKLVISPDFKASCFGIVVPQAVSKKATKRNMLKRRVRAVILKQLNGFKDGFAVLIYAKKETGGLSFREIEKELLALFKKSKILEL